MVDYNLEQWAVETIKNDCHGPDDILNHGKADLVLIAVLRQLGYVWLVDAYKRIPDVSDTLYSYFTKTMERLNNNDSHADT